MIPCLLQRSRNILNFYWSEQKLVLLPFADIFSGHTRFSFTSFFPNNRCFCIRLPNVECRRKCLNLNRNTSRYELLLSISNQCAFKWDKAFRQFFALFQTIYQLKLTLSNHLYYTAYKVHKHIYNNKECLLYNTTDINSYTFSFVSYLEKVKF